MAEKRKKIGYLMMIPTLLLICVLILYPTFETIYNSFFEYRTQTAATGIKFIGFDNYVKLFNDTFFWDSLWWTLLFTAVSVGLELVIGMALALLMTKKIFGQGLIRTVILIPWAIPTIVAGIIWTQFFAVNGLANSALQFCGVIESAVPWLGSEGSAKVAILIADIWKNTPYMSLLLLAGLLTIAPEYYEAAKIDGASKFKQFVYITLPLVKATMMVTILFRIISAMRVYDLIVAMTNGGPGGITTPVSMYAVNTYFTYGNIGYGSTISVMLLIVSILISLLFLNSLQTRLK